MATCLYPSGPQQIGPDRHLVADYESPGAIVEFNRAGQVLRHPRAGGLDSNPSCDWLSFRPVAVGAGSADRALSARSAGRPSLKACTAARP